MASKAFTQLMADLEQARLYDTQLHASADKIHLNKMIGQLAFLYEKIRNAIDYQEDHLLRKDAIERIMKRRLVSGATAAGISRALINELIRAQYLKDGAIPEQKIFEVSQIIDKYIELRNHLLDIYDSNEIHTLHEWIMGIQAYEIERCLVSPLYDDAYLKFLFSSTVYRVKTTDEKLITQKNLELQIYIACVRSIMKSDDDMVSYLLLVMFYPEWKSIDKDKIYEIAQKLDIIKKQIDAQINHPIGFTILKRIRPYGIYTRILQSLINSENGNISALLGKLALLEQKIKVTCSAIYKNVQNKLQRNVVRSIIYLLVTKAVLALIIELPIDTLLYGHVNYVSAIVNILLQPVLLLLITLSARAPSENNTKKIVSGIKEIIFGNGDLSLIFEVKKVYKRNRVLENIFRLLYILTFLISYGLIIRFLQYLNFSIVSGGLFLFFLSIVSYFGIRTRKIAKEYVVIEHRENVLTFLLDLFSYPIIRVGHWISLKSSQINIFVFIFDFIIEAPFKILIEVFEDWFSYIKEKKEEIY